MVTIIQVEGPWEGRRGEGRGGEGRGGEGRRGEGKMEGEHYMPAPTHKEVSPLQCREMSQKVLSQSP